MKQVSTEVNFYSREDTLHKNTVVPDSEFVPAADAGRGLLARQAKDVATIALANVAKLPEFYEAFRHNVTTAVEQGTLDLETKYPQLDPDERVSQFVVASIEHQLVDTPTEELMADVNPDNIDNSSLSTGPIFVQELQHENERLKQDRVTQQLTILELRALTIENGATPEQLLEFDRVAKLATAPQLEASDNVTNGSRFTEKFRSIVRPLISRKALEAIGLVSPRSAEVTVIHSQEIITS